jgi:hypothetical protein
MSARVIAIVVCLSALTVLSGCKKLMCDDYLDGLRDDVRRRELTDWADREIFSRTFTPDDFGSGGPTGPGKGGRYFRIERANISIPDSLSGYLIRSVGPDLYHPEVLLVGARRYQGYLISRGTFEQGMSDAGISIPTLEAWRERVGVMCFL